MASRPRDAPNLGWVPTSSSLDALRLHAARSLLSGERDGGNPRGDVERACETELLGASCTAPVLSPSLLSLLLLHGLHTSKNQQEPALGAQKPAEESCYLDLLERLPHSSSGQMQK